MRGKKKPKVFQLPALFFLVDDKELKLESSTPIFVETLFVRGA